MEFTREELMLISKGLWEGESLLRDKAESYAGDYTPEEISAIKREAGELSKLQYKIDTQLYTKGNIQ